MSVWAVTMVKNEAATIEQVIRHLLAEGVEHVVVADNLSTDSTRSILDRLAETLPVTVVDDPEPGYFQSEKMTRLAMMATEHGAEWIVPFDADELWISTDGRHLADVLRDSHDADVLVGEWFNHYPLPFRPARMAGWTLRERQSHAQPKVAFRPVPGFVIAQGNHDVSGPTRRVSGRIEVHHYPYRSFRHFVSKNRAGKAAVDAAGCQLPPESGEEWRRYGARSAPRLLASWANVYRHVAVRGLGVDRPRVTEGRTARCIGCGHRVRRSGPCRRRGCWCHHTRSGSHAVPVTLPGEASEETCPRCGTIWTPGGWPADRHC